MKTIAVITTTRAEFGLLMPVIKELKKYETDNIDVEVVVTGTHLKWEFGHTVDEIITEGIEPDVEIEIPVESRDERDISYNQAVTLELFTDLFLQKKYAGIVLLGDRYEMLSVAIAAGNTHTPVFHLCGGDTTEGAIDEWIRHSITKMSYLHFPTNTESYYRVIQLGEAPERVFNFGSTSIDNIISMKKMSKISALRSINLPDCKYAVCTYHPVTMDTGSPEEDICHFLKAIEDSKSIEFIVTKSNADMGGEAINRLLDAAEERISNLHVYSSLGTVRYLSLMTYAEFVLGNSSSGIIEAPALGIPSINIGERQRGRLQPESVVNCSSDYESILNAIQIACEGSFREKCRRVVNPYGDGHAAEKIAKKIIETVETTDTIDLKKKFYNV